MANSIHEMIDEIFEDLCDNYCKYPEQYTEETEDDLYKEHCDNCPMMRW